MKNTWKSVLKEKNIKIKEYCINNNPSAFPLSMFAILEITGNDRYTFLQNQFTNDLDNKKFTLENLIELCSINPAKRFGIFPNKGSINLNNNADITIINLNKTHKYSLQNQFSKAKKSDVLYTNKKYKGKIEYTIVNGDIIYNGKIINVNNKPGKFLSPND